MAESEEQFYSVSARAVVEGESPEDVERYLRDVLHHEPGFHDVFVSTAVAVRRAGGSKPEASKP